MLGDSTKCYISLHCWYLEYLDDLELGVHDQDVLLLRLALLDVPLGGSGQRRHGQEPPAPEHHLGHQLPHAVD